METVTASLQHYGVLLVFANVFLQQLGAPVPAFPTLVLAGALSVTGLISAPATLAAAIVASLVADSAWYAAGVRYGRPVLTTLCRISLSPDSCVRQSEDRLARWGAWALLIGKFVPGLSTVAPPVAGLVGMRPRTFALASTAAAALYLGLAVALGVVFHDQVYEVLAAAMRACGGGGARAHRAPRRVRRIPVAAAVAFPAQPARRPRVGRGGPAADRSGPGARDPRRAVGASRARGSPAFAAPSRPTPVSSRRSGRCSRPTSRSWSTAAARTKRARRSSPTR